MRFFSRAFLILCSATVLGACGNATLNRFESDAGLHEVHADGGHLSPVDAGHPTQSGTGNYCAACTSDATCGGGNNFCLAFEVGGSYCGTDCSHGESCPTGATCYDIT